MSDGKVEQINRDEEQKIIDEEQKNVDQEQKIIDEEQKNIDQEQKNIDQQNVSQECDDKNDLITEQRVENGFELLSMKDIGNDNTVGVIEIMEGDQCDVKDKKLGDAEKLKGDDREKSEGNDEEKSNGSDQEKSNGSDQEKSKGSDEEKSKESDEEKSKGGDEEKSKGGDEEKSKESDEEKSKGGDEKKSKEGDEEKSKEGDEEKSKESDEEKSKGSDEEKSKGGDEEKSKGYDEEKSKGDDEEKSKESDEEKSKGSDEVKSKGGDEEKFRDNRDEKTKNEESTKIEDNEVQKSNDKITKEESEKIYKLEPDDDLPEYKRGDDLPEYKTGDDLEEYKTGDDLKEYKTGFDLPEYKIDDDLEEYKIDDDLLEHKRDDESLKYRSEDFDENGHKKVFRQTLNQQPVRKMNDKEPDMDSINLEPNENDDYDGKLVTRNEIFYNITSLVLYIINLISQIVLGIHHFGYCEVSSFFTFYFILLASIYSSNIGDITGIFKYLVSSKRFKYWGLRLVSSIFGLTPLLQHSVNVKVIKKSLATADDETKKNHYYTYKRMKKISDRLHDVIRYLGAIPQFCLQIYIATNYFKISKIISVYHKFLLVITVLYTLWIELHQHELPRFVVDKRWRKVFGSILKATGSLIPVLCRMICTGLILTNNELTKCMVLIFFVIHGVISILYNYCKTSEGERNVFNVWFRGVSMMIKPDRCGSLRSYMIQNVILQVEDSVMMVYWFWTCYDDLSVEDRLISLVLTETVMCLDIIFRAVQIAAVKFQDYFHDDKAKSNLVLVDI